MAIFKQGIVLVYKLESTGEFIKLYPYNSTTKVWSEMPPPNQQETLHIAYVGLPSSEQDSNWS